LHILITAISSAKCPSGICRHAANLASSLAATRDVSRVTMLVGPWQLSYFRSAFNLQSAKVNLVAANVSNDPYARNLWYYRTLPRLARDHKAELVHLSFPVPIARRRFSCPVLCSLHDLYPYDAPANFGALRVLFNRSFLKQCLKVSDFVVCSSDFTLERLCSSGPASARKKATRIYQAVGLDPSCSQRPHLPQLFNRPFLLCVAQHRSNKNLGLLLSAFGELVLRGDVPDDFRLAIVGGEGPETKALHDSVQRLPLANRVIFKSTLLDSELCWLYSNCELVVLPSKIEGFCLPLIEALRCGSRVLCSDIPVLREVGGSSCSYFDLAAQNPIEALTVAINSSLRRPKPQPAEFPRFGAPEVARQYAALYRSLIEGRSPAVHNLPDADVIGLEKHAV
jgi:glycosyltransferase involved in cell wall biosynthesis